MTISYVAIKGKLGFVPILASLHFSKDLMKFIFFTKNQGSGSVCNGISKVTLLKFLYLLVSHLLDYDYRRPQRLKPVAKAFLALPSPMPFLLPEVLSSSDTDEEDEALLRPRKIRRKSKLPKRDFLQEWDEKPEKYLTYCRMSKATLDKLMDIVGKYFIDLKCKIF